VTGYLDEYLITQPSVAYVGRGVRCLEGSGRPTAQTIGKDNGLIYKG